MSNRRLFSFRLSTLLLAVTAIALALGAPHLYRQIQFWRLQSYVGRDLRKLTEDEQKTFNSIVESVLAPPKRPVFDTFENWFVWRVPTDRGERIVLFQASRLWMIPGNSHARLYFFDRTGRRVGESMFQVGYRIDIEDAALITDKFHGESLLQIKSTPSINGADIATQYYSLSHNRCDLLRLEEFMPVNPLEGHWDGHRQDLVDDTKSGIAERLEKHLRVRREIGGELGARRQPTRELQFAELSARIASQGPGN
jgi:hypothetical protein